MTTDTLKNNQLSNNKIPIFKSELKQIILHKLKLSNNNIIDIPVRKDGMVNATFLCKAGNKQMADYNRNKQKNI